MRRTGYRKHTEYEFACSRSTRAPPALRWAPVASGFEELTTGIEPVTSSLPRMCSTD